MAKDDEGTTDDQIRRELDSSSAVNDGADSSGSDVQASLDSGLPDYLSFLKPQGSPGALGGLGQAVTGGADGGRFGNVSGTPAPGLGSASLSFKGGTEHGKKYASGAFGGADKAVDDFAAQDNQRVADEQARSDKHYADAEQVGRDQIDSVNDYQKRDDELQQRVLAFNEHAAATEERMNGEAKAERERYLGNYREQLAGVRLLAMQSGNPLNAMGKGGAIGLAAAEFAQGFLAARGIHIDVSGQVDKWVDRSIQEHQMKVQNARESANDQLHLYEIARQSSQDDWEARQRYRGFVIEGLKTQIQGNANRFQSSILASRAQESIAKLQIESDSTQRQIGDSHFNRVHQMMTTEYDRAYKQGMLGIEQYKAETQRRAEEDKNNSKAKYVPITDIEPTVGPDGKPTYRVIGHIDASDKDAMKQAHESRANTLMLYKALDRYEAARKIAYDKFGHAPVNQRMAAMESPEIRSAERERRAVIQQIRLATTGKVFGEKEGAEYENGLPDNTFWQKGNNDTAIPELRERLRAAHESKMSTYTVEGQNGMEVHVAPHSAAEYRAMTSTEPADTRRTIPDMITSAAESEDAAKTLVAPSRAFKYLLGDEKEPENATSAELLARMALDPHHARSAFGLGDKSYYAIPEDDVLLRKQAIDGLNRLVAERDAELSGYAQILLTKIEEDPEGLRKLLGPEEHTANYKPTRIKK